MLAVFSKRCSFLDSELWIGVILSFPKEDSLVQNSLKTQTLPKYLSYLGSWELQRQRFTFQKNELWQSSFLYCAEICRLQYHQVTLLLSEANSINCFSFR